MKAHFLVLSALHIVIGAVEVLLATLTALAIPIAGFFSFDLTTLGITSLFAIPISAMLLLTGIPSIAGGLGLYYRKEWARIVLLVMGLVSLPLGFPFGAILGVYTIVVLTRSEAAELLARAPNGSPA